MKKFISLVLALVMALSLTTVAWGASATTAVAETGGTTYDTLKAAYDAAAVGGSITLKKDVTDGDGLVISKSVVIDFGGYTYTVDSDPVGSAGTETLGFQILDTAVAVTLKNGTLTSKASSGVKMLVQNYCNLTLDGMTLIGTNLDGGGKYVLSNNAGDVVIEDTTITAAADGVAFDSYDYSAGGYTTPPTVTVKGTSVVNGKVESDGGELVVEAGTFNGEITVTNAADVTVKGGTFTDDVSAYVAPGYVLDNGVVKSDISDAKTTYNGLYLKGTNQGDVITANPVSLGYYKANAAKYDKVDGHVTAKGNVAYFLADDLAYSGVYVQVNALHQADVVAYADAAGTIVKFYLDDISDATYYEGTVFNNFGEKCGQVDMDPVAGVTYYTVKGDLTKAVYASAKTGSNLMVGGKLITVDPVPAATAYVGHTIVTESEDGELVKVYCSACKLQAVKAPNYMSIPKGAEIAVTGTNWYWPVVGGAVADDKVESAETFDAGIAMYVGMSVMAAAGSAVVLKKKD